VAERETAATEAATTTWSPIVELRQYTLHPGARDQLIELFDREFVESQETLGIKVIGQFRTPDDPNRFIWLRGFPDMPTRARALQNFYDGPVWKRHRNAANATMIDSDNVLMLRPARTGSGFALSSKRPPVGSEKIPNGLIVATIYHLDESNAEHFGNVFEQAFAPGPADVGASILAVFATETAPNNFPRLPIREGEQVLVCFTGFTDEAAYDRHRAALAETNLGEALARELDTVERETWRLRPTARSQLRGS
jgi:hypothetical protein